MAPAKGKAKPQKKASSKAPQKRDLRTVKKDSSPTIPSELQQLLLNIFWNSFSTRLDTDVKPLLQEIKGHLYKRDFVAAFDKEEYLQAYAARWSPSRALGYLHVFDEIQEELDVSTKKICESSEENQKVVCLGGGAGAELVALAGLQKMVKDRAGGSRALAAVAIDIADWRSVVEDLHHHIVTAPPLSKYASVAAQASNAPLLGPEDLDVTFHQHDILNTSFSTLKPFLQDATLTTIMFTLNELYSTSLSLTQTLLLNLMSCLQPGALLLVVDSPGSYSTVTLNGAEKKYPMQWLLDHTLLGKGGKEQENPSWEKIKEDESKWFRLDDSLRYPIELENMRFQLHLYRRLG